jgi:hypothetical protein
MQCVSKTKWDSKATLADQGLDRASRILVANADWKAVFGFTKSYCNE